MMEGDTVTVVLNDPSPELAERLRRTLGADEQLIGMKMSAMGGSNPMPLNSLASVAGFLRIPDYASALRQGSQETIGYIDPAAIVKWLRGVFGDDELADAVQAEIDTGEVFGIIAPRIKELLQIRAIQIAPEPEPETAEATAANEG